MFEVSLWDRPAGYIGDTAASHSGRLLLTGGTAVDADTVRVTANTPAAAVRNALSGTISVQWQNKSTTYEFSPSTVGTSKASQKPFHLDLAAGTGHILLEDTAGYPATSDWDYNDHSWRVGVREVNARQVAGTWPAGSVASGPARGEITTSSYELIDSDSWELVDNMGQTASVDYQVSWYDENTYLWEYDVVNNNLNSMAGSSNKGLVSFSVYGSPYSGMYDSYNSVGWVGEPDAPNWVRPEETTGGGILPGQSGHFEFKTPVRPIITAGSAAGAGARWPTLATYDQGKGPGGRCDLETQPGVVTLNGWGAWRQAATGEPRGPVNAGTPGWTENPAGVWNTPKPAGAPPANLGEEGAYFRTKDEFGPFKLDVQFKFGVEPAGPPGGVQPGLPGKVLQPTNQDFGSSGVYIHNRYEVQIIDPSRFRPPAGPYLAGQTIQDDPQEAANNKTVANSRNKLLPGGLYGLDPPNGEFINCAISPIMGDGWNDLHIDYCPPDIRNGVIVVPARIETVLNGAVIWKGDIVTAAGVAIKGTGGKSNASPVSYGPVYLQSHWGNQVMFRSSTITGRKVPGV